MEKPSSGHSYFKLYILHLPPRAQTCSQSCCLPKITQDFGRGFAHPCLAWPRLSQLLSRAGVPAGDGWMSPGGKGVLQVWPARPKCNHAKGNFFLFQPSIGNFTSSALAAPRDLTRMEKVSVWHLKTPLRGPNCSLSPGWTSNLESSGSQHSLGWVLAPSGGCSCFPTSSEQPWMKMEMCWPSTSLEQNQGPFPRVLSIPASPAPPHCTCFILCLFLLTLNQFCQLLNYFNFSSFSKSLKYILYIGYRLKKESYRCALASEILPEKCVYFISAFHFSRHFLL